jgi:hypothetical protein
VLPGTGCKFVGRTPKSLADMMFSRSLKWMIMLWLLVIAMLVLLRIQQRTLVDAPVQRSELSGSIAPETEPDQAVRFTRKQLRSDKSSFLADRFSRYLAMIEQEHDDLERERKMQNWIDGMILADMPAALEFLKQHNSSELCQNLEVRLTRRWAEADPAAAAAWAQQMPAGRARSEALNGVAIAWANVDASEAIQWVRQWPEGEERQNGLASVAYEVARTDPIEAMNLAVNLPSNQSRDDLINFTAAQWAASTPAVAAEWAQQIPDQGLRVQVLGKIATEWGEEDPVKAATMALTLPPGKIQDDVVISIVERWVQKDPLAARSWVEQFPEGSLRETAIDNLTKLWPVQN